VKRRYNRAALVLGALVLALGAAIPATAEFPMAGVDPSQRPQGAPIISEVVKGPGWYTRALTGVSRPYPASLRFLEDQGNWYTPFIHPGMPGRYDLRGWHSQ
jgi:hypothetical protein